ncbi:UDP-glucose 4-epimerase GalE [Shewanella sp. 6_MG-2023]|uniref:UDP-glucose 4-epimerase GalE n=1 Tax=Shewanella sp. 6_MG-2023 TaxID=3062660 RepID=UPI0026E372C5|nr:UDP-glucose 4-epimerase GalE [Shewanella sp. 6_MG-2023]MDO6620600.1 UDP-glucose 4-epimerase GalE [Shewanella sp. 6_MG-2023]
MAILVTGGAGYIGSHTVVELLNANQQVIIVDNLSNANVIALSRIEQITGKSCIFYQGSVLNKALLHKIFTDHVIESVIHFAGLKAVADSVCKPLQYYETNVTGTIILCQVMAEHQVKKLVFSSSATVYGIPDGLPIKETDSTGATNPYGQSKLMVEQLLADLHTADNQWDITILRYFNPVGAHPSGLIGEDPSDIPNNLMPYICQVAVGKLKELQVFGNDYLTPDGTGVRDYIHVVDLAQGHLKALAKLNSNSGIATYNLGTGRGYSVIEIINTFEQITGKAIPYCFSARREGDLAAYFADVSHAKTALDWHAELSLETMVESSWHWQSKNPDGYRS